MRNILTLTAMLSLVAGAVASTPASAADAAKQILDHHVASMKNGDLEGVLSDYADNAVVSTPHGIAPEQKAVSGADVFAGKDNFRKLFATLTDKDHVPGNRSMQTRYESRPADVTLMYWVQNRGTANQVSGTDIFVVRGGKIVFQSVLIDPPKK
jgi:ketosteroid isomerase-like protein